MHESYYFYVCLTITWINKWCIPTEQCIHSMVIQGVVKQSQGFSRTYNCNKIYMPTVLKWHNMYHLKIFFSLNPKAFTQGPCLQLFICLLRDLILEQATLYEHLSYKYRTHPTHSFNGERTKLLKGRSISRA
jgi:hypothetical protein